MWFPRDSLVIPLGTNIVCVVCLESSMRRIVAIAEFHGHMDN